MTALTMDQRSTALHCKILHQLKPCRISSDLPLQSQDSKRKLTLRRRIFSSLDINVLQQQLGYNQGEEPVLKDNSRTLPLPESSGMMFCPTKEKIEESTLPWDKTMKYEEAPNMDDTLPWNHMKGGGNKRKQAAEDQSNNNSKSKQRASS